MKAAIFIVSLGLLLTACSGETPREIPSAVIQRDSMIILLAELQLINAKSQHREIRKGKLNEFVIEEQIRLFDSLGLNMQRFDSSMTFYLKDYEDMQSMHDEAMNLLSSKLAEITLENKDSTTAELSIQSDAPR